MMLCVLRRISLFIILGLLFTYVGEAYAVTIKSGHPRMFVTPDNIATLRARVASGGTHSATYAAIKSWCDTNWDNTALQISYAMGDGQDDRDYDSGVMRYALIYILGEISGYNWTTPHALNEYGDKAVSILLAMAGGSGSIFHIQHASVAYDWVSMASPKDSSYRMTTGQKTTIVNWLISTASSAYGCSQPCLNPSYYGYRYSTWVGLYPPLAAYGDGISDTTLLTWLNFIPTFLDDGKALSHASGVDGASRGSSYTRYGF